MQSLPAFQKLALDVCEVHRVWMLPAHTGPSAVASVGGRDSCAGRTEGFSPALGGWLHSQDEWQAAARGQLKQSLLLPPSLSMDTSCLAFLDPQVLREPTDPGLGSSAPIDEEETSWSCYLSF